MLVVLYSASASDATGVPAGRETTKSTSTEQVEPAVHTASVQVSACKSHGRQVSKSAAKRQADGQPGIKLQLRALSLLRFATLKATYECHMKQCSQTESAGASCKHACKAQRPEHTLAPNPLQMASGLDHSPANADLCWSRPCTRLQRLILLSRLRIRRLQSGLKIRKVSGTSGCLQSWAPCTTHA